MDRHRDGPAHGIPQRQRTQRNAGAGVGCLETARLMVEAGLCLAQDEKKLPVAQGGFWTPSTGMGSLLWNRILNKDTNMVVQSFPADQSHQAKL